MMNPGTYEPPYILISGVVYSDGVPVAVGESITYTITDATTGGQIGTFTGVVNGYKECSVTFSLDSSHTMMTYVGQAVTPYQGCALSPVSAPAADVLVFSGAYGGDASFAPSMSAQQPF
jgi:hypothetical protein